MFKEIDMHTIGVILLLEYLGLDTLHKNNDNSFQLETIEGVYVDDFDLDTLVNFINHASGRKFNSELLDYCQNSINFRTD